MLRSLLLLTTALTLGSQATLTADDYIWPMKITPELTSRFCDNRAGHFHAGLDIRTKGKTGFRVYAVDNGHIYRVTTSYNGYGKAVYLKLSDGRTAVYGHLLRFEKDLDERVRKIQLRQKRYRQDIYFKAGEIPVKKGQVVGLSGASGAGAPHLHFEIRSPNNNPLNPLKFGFGVTDNKVPVFDKLAIRVYPEKFDPGAPANTEIFDLLKNGYDFVLDDTIFADGYATLSVSGGDKVDGKGFLYGFYSLRLYLDDSLFFSSVADSITYETTKQKDYIRDMEFSGIAGSGKNRDKDENVFYKLFIPPGADQYFWSNENNSGIIPPADQPGQIRNFRIVASDEAGNESRLTGILAAARLKPPEPEFISYYRFGDTLEIDFLTLDTVRFCHVQYRNTAGSIFKTIESSLKSKVWTRNGMVAYLNTVRSDLKKKKTKGDYRFAFSDARGDLSPWIYFSGSAVANGLRLSGTPGHLKIEYCPDSIYTSLSIGVASDVRDINGEMMQGGIQTYYFDIFDEIIEGETRITIRDKSSVIIDTTLFLFLAGNGKRVSAISPDSALTLIVNDNSLFYPAYLFPSVGNAAKVMGNAAIVYDIEPSNLLANKPITFQFDLKRLGLDGKRMGVYGYSSLKNKWGFIGTNSGSLLAIEGFGLGKVALVEDNDPPKIKSIRPRGRIKSRKPLLSCVITDDISGVKLDSTPQMWIDGFWVPAEYDIDTKKFTYLVRNNLKRSKHTIVIEAVDKQGNKKRKTSSFTIGR